MSLSREEIIRMALESGYLNLSPEQRGMELAELERFAALVAAADREQCAKICDARYEEYFVADMDDKAFASLFCAQDIRARGNGGEK